MIAEKQRLKVLRMRHLCRAKMTMPTTADHAHDATAHPTPDPEMLRG